LFSINKIFSPNGVSFETSSDFRRTTAHLRRGAENPSEKRTDVAKQLGLPPSTLNTIIAKKKIREHSYMSVDQELTMCGVLCVKKCVVSWEVEVAWRRCNVVVVVMMTMKLSFTEALRAFESMRTPMTSLKVTKQTPLILKVYCSI
jgi:hypothetical protein